MPIVTCPKCRARYNPGIDEELEDLPDNLSMKVVCPACGQWMRLPEQEPVEAPDVSPDVLEGMKSQSKLVSAGDEPRSRRRREEDDDGPRRRREDDEDDRPRRRRRDDDEFDDDRDDGGRRRRRWADQDRDDFDDDPRGPRSGRADGLGVASMIIGIISCVVALPGFCCILFSGLGLVGGIVAVVLGFMGKSQNPESGQAKTGIITGFIAIGLSVAFVVLSLVLGFGRAMFK